MRPWVVSSSKGTATGTGTTGITIDRPGGVRPGDVLYAFLSRADDTGTAYASDGWTSLTDATSTTGNDIRGNVLRRVVTGNEPTSYTFTNAAGDSINMTGILVCVRGADVNTPEAATSTSATGSNDFTPAASSITTTTGHCLILTAHGASMDSGTSGKVGGAPSGFTLVDYIEETTAAAFESFIEVAYLDQTNPAASGTAAWTGTADDATSEFVTMTVAVRCGTPLRNPGVVVITMTDPYAADWLLGVDVATTQLGFARTATDTLLGGDIADIGEGGTPNPIIFHPVESTYDVPGWNLIVEEPLLFAPVDGAIDVPGWILYVTDPVFDPDMTADIFLLDDFIADPTIEPLVTLTLEEDRAWDWTDPLSEAGAGSITLAANDPEMVWLDTDELIAVGFNMYGARRFLMVVEDDDAVDISDDDEIAEATRFNGRGTGVVMEFGDVDPTGGPYRSPVEEDRHLGWSAPSFDHASWAAVGVVGTLQHIINVGALLLAGGFNEQFGENVETMTEQVLRNIPTTAVPMLWAPPASALSAPVGECFFYEDETMNTGLFIGATGDYTIHFICDDEGEFAVDGQMVGSVQGLNWVGHTAVSVTLSAGGHSIAGRVRNLEFGDVNGQNGAIYGWVIARESAITTVMGTQESVEIIAMSSANAKMVAYPTNGTPGQTITKTLRILVEECQARGFLLGVNLGFTDTTYTDGTAPIVLPDFACKVGSSLLSVLDQMAQTYIDWDLDPVTLTLNVWAKGAQGFTRPATFDVAPDQGIPGEAETVTANITSLRRRRERRKLTRALIRWPGGWAEALGPAGGGEAPLEFGAAQSLDEVERIGAGEIATFGDPRTQIDVGIRPERAADAPYLGWRKGDTIDYAYGNTFERVVATTIETNSEDPEDPTIIASLRHLVPTAAERQANDLRNLL